MRTLSSLEYLCGSKPRRTKNPLPWYSEAPRAISLGPRFGRTKVFLVMQEIGSCCAIMIGELSCREKVPRWENVGREKKKKRKKVSRGKVENKASSKTYT